MSDYDPEHDFDRRSDVESRLDALEIARATQNLQLKQTTEELSTGKVKFQTIVDALHDQRIEIELLKTMREDIVQIKECVTKLKTAELERRGVWKVVAVVSAVITFIVQGLIMYFTSK